MYDVIQDLHGTFLSDTIEYLMHVSNEYMYITS